MGYIHRVQYLLLLLLFIISCTPTEPEEYYEEKNVSECNGPYGYDCGDFTLLQQFIDLNSQIFRHYMDNDKNGIVGALEFGYQVWDDGRLIQLNLNYNKDVIMKPNNSTELDPTNYRLTVIPDNIGILTFLEGLFLHDNEFSSIPKSFGNLTNLKTLDLEDNLLSTLPNEFGSLLNIERLVLNSNQITILPETFGSLISLEKFWAIHNQLEYLPENLGNISQLEWLYLNDNSLRYLPESIGNLENLTILNLDNNSLSYLPESMCNEIDGSLTMYEGLGILSIDNNEFCTNEGMPSCINEDYGSQQCSNCAPWEFNIGGYCADSTDYNILQMFLDYNRMAHYILNDEGNYTFGPDGPDEDELPDTLITTFPDSASACVNTDWWHDGRLVEITFQYMELYSIIPANIGDLDRLQIIRLTGNQLKGEIPNSILNLPNIQVLKLNSNSLIGNIPDSIGLLIDLDTLWLNNNQLSGGIPQRIFSLDGLQDLRLDNNDLDGSISENLGDLSSIQYLRLDNNNLSGGIPQSIGNLINLRRLYLLNNNLSDQIPESICTIYANNENFRSYLHNNQLCPGTTGYPACLPNSHLGNQNTSGCGD